jgi:hypothetical protein
MNARTPLVACHRRAAPAGAAHKLASVREHGFSFLPWAYHFFDSSLQRPVIRRQLGDEVLELLVLLLELPQPLGFANLQPAVLLPPAFGDRHPCGPQR